MSHELDPSGTHGSSVAVRLIAGRARACCGRWGWPVVGVIAVAWFLIRVVPKPSRAMYPCQRAAFPVASAFIIWLIGVVTSVLAFRRSRRFLARSRVA